MPTTPCQIAEHDDARGTRVFWLTGLPTVVFILSVLMFRPFLGGKSGPSTEDIHLIVKVAGAQMIVLVAGYVLTRRRIKHIVTVSLLLIAIMNTIPALCQIPAFGNPGCNHIDVEFWLRRYRGEMKTLFVPCCVLAVVCWLSEMLSRRRDAESKAE